MFFLHLLLLGCDSTKIPNQSPVIEDSAEPNVLEPSDPDEPSDTVEPSDELECDDERILALDWFDLEVTEQWGGTIEYGQTQVTDEDESRLAPTPSAERETLILFTPDLSISEDRDLRLAAYKEEELMGVLSMNSPSAIPEAVEQGLSSTVLDPYSIEAWTAILPWTWIQEGVEIRIAGEVESGLGQFSTTLQDLNAPHVLTLTRSKVVFFGDGTEDVETLSGSRMAQDHFSTVPGAELRLVEVNPWRLEEVVVQTADGGRLVSSEEERLSTTSAPDRWSLLKHQISIRGSLANTGRGLSNVGLSYGDSSPYSFGSYLGMGWVRNNDGTINDLNNAPYAAGWTGWAAIWLSECGNTIAHELGHSYTLYHFTGQTAASWGIEEEYPLDGTHIESHPWGYDSTRRLLRTWYRVDGSGAVEDVNGLVGKRDPMNGGEAGNSKHCYPQYTPYHAQKIQNWSTGTPNLMNIEGQSGVYLWNSEDHQYALTAQPSGDGAVQVVDVPVATFVGTLSNDDTACQTYPPRFMALGNVFEYPDPEDSDLPSAFDGAQWFVEIEFADGSMDRALIAKSAIESSDTGLYLYSFNVENDREPTTVNLYRSILGYPNIEPSTAERVHSRSVTQPDSIVEPIRVGRGYIANTGLNLTQLCTKDVDCDSKSLLSTWRDSLNQRHFTHSSIAESELCMERGGFSTIQLPVVNESGEEAIIIAHAQRVLHSGSHEVSVPINDRTPWIDSPDLEQSLKVWLPYEENSMLSAGEYSLSETVEIEGLVDDFSENSTKFSIDLTVHSLVIADFNIESGGYWTDAVYQEGSSVYFTVSDDSYGPTWGDWWNPSALSNTLFPLVMDEDTGELFTLQLNANKVACGSWWGFNTGQSSEWNCDNIAALSISEEGNELLQSGHSYISPGSSPLIVQARRWHQPNASQIIEEFALSIKYTVP